MRGEECAPEGTSRPCEGPEVAGTKGRGPGTSVLGPPECPFTPECGHSMNRCPCFCTPSLPWSLERPGYWGCRNELCSRTGHLVIGTDSPTYSCATSAQPLPPPEPQLSLSGQQDKNAFLLGLP